jgi:hypothetical protein
MSKGGEERRRKRKTFFFLSASFVVGMFFQTPPYSNWVGHEKKGQGSKRSAKKPVFIK